MTSSTVVLPAARRRSRKRALQTGGTSVSLPAPTTRSLHAAMSAVRWTGSCACSRAARPAGKRRWNSAESSGQLLAPARCSASVS